jgi:hypothetical protein
MTYYVAKFSDGTALLRSTSSRVYTHAYLAHGSRPDPGENYTPEARAIRTWRKSGFSSSAEQARKNMEAETAWYQRNSDKYTRALAEVVAVTEIDAKTYLALKRREKDAN